MPNDRGNLETADYAMHICGLATLLLVYEYEMICPTSCLADVGLDDMTKVQLIGTDLLFRNPGQLRKAFLYIPRRERGPGARGFCETRKP